MCGRQRMERFRCIRAAGGGWTGGGGSWLGSCYPQGGLAVAPEDLEATGTPLVPGAAIGCVGA